MKYGVGGRGLPWVSARLISVVSTFTRYKMHLNYYFNVLNAVNVVIYTWK